MQLPPKRYQPDSDTKYDNIRWLPWFHDLAERRRKIPMLTEAAKLVSEGLSIEKAAAEFGVDDRELGDYLHFMAGRSRLSEIEPIGTRRAYQMILDHAYDVYRDSFGRRSLTKIIYDESQLFGVNPRHVVEIWDLDPAFYPTHYKGER